jgi:alkylation response protein AidB-like acyl-CoA dehydrogenase
MPDPAALIEAARQHVATVVDPQVETWETGDAFPRQAAREAAQAGLLGLFAPTAVGGQGLSYAEGMPVFEALGRGDASYAFALSMHNAVTATIGHHGQPAVRDHWTPLLAAGEALGGFSLTEPHAGSDAAAITTRAVPDGKGYRLNGRKAWVSLVGEADVFLVIARTGTERGTRDVLMAVVPRDRPGVTVERVYRKMASSFLPVGEMGLDDVEVRPEEVLAPEGAGFKAGLGAIDVARVDIAAIAVGLAEAALDIALRHARDRAAFGGTLLDLQGLQFALADVATDIAAGRLLYADAAAQLGTPEGTVAAAHAKRFCPDMALRAALECSEVLGAYGWLHDTPLPRLIALGRMLQSVDGTAEIQKVVIARDLVRRAGTL